MEKIDFPTLLRLATASAGVTAPCACERAALAAWQPLPPTLELELDQFEQVGSLIDDPYAEPTFKEFHPDGSRNDSDDAPIAPRYYPYNRSQVLRCVQCGRHYLRYTEAGGYFSEDRVRALNPRLLVDAPL